MKKNRTAILKHLCACALTITMAFVVPSAGYAAGTDTLGFGAGGPGTNVDAYGNPVSGVVAKGITVSKYQYRASAANGGIDWDTVKKSGVSFAMIRLGYYNDLDPNFVENMKGALAAGLKTGIFFYTQALDVDTARAEADFVLSQIKDYPISYPVAYDVESDTILQNGLTKQQITDQVKAFCERIAAAGYRLFNSTACWNAWGLPAASRTPSARKCWKPWAMPTIPPLWKVGSTIWYCRTAASRACSSIRTARPGPFRAPRKPPRHTNRPTTIAACRSPSTRRSRSNATASTPYPFDLRLLPSAQHHTVEAARNPGRPADLRRLP